MGESDWGTLDDGLSAAVLARGVTAGIAPPPGQGDFTYGYNSLSSEDAGAHGKYVNLANFTPMGSGPSSPDGGGSIRGCVKRVPSAGNTGMSPMLYICNNSGGTPSVNDNAYLIGLSDADPYEIVLAKGVISSGLNADNTTILRRSSSEYIMGDDIWHHLRLDAIVQPNGDVLLQVFKNNLDDHPLGNSPDWEAIPGMSEYIDDAIQINSESAPLLGGYIGYAFAINNALNRRGAFKSIQALRIA